MERARQRTETAIDSPFGRNVNRQVVLSNREHFMLVESLAQYFSHVPLFNDIQYVRRTAQILYNRLTFMNTSITCDSCNIVTREVARDTTAIKYLWKTVVIALIIMHRSKKLAMLIMLICRSEYIIGEMKEQFI